MVKMADSAIMRQNIATRPFEGCTHGFSASACAAATVLIASEPHSYFQSGSSGCFISHSGRRLVATGSTSKLYEGGGDGVAHSKVHASHGSFPASGPLK